MDDAEKGDGILSATDQSYTDKTKIPTLIENKTGILHYAYYLISSQPRLYILTERGEANLESRESTREKGENESPTTEQQK